MQNEVTFNITKHIAVLSENAKGFTKEINFVSWNGGDSKLDIRDWFPDHSRCGKGVTLTEDEACKLYSSLKTLFNVTDG